MGDAPDRIRLPKTTAEAWAVETDPALMANGEANWPLYVRADIAPTDAEVEAAAKAICDWVPALRRQTARLVARAALLAGRKGRSE